MFSSKRTSGDDLTSDWVNDFSNWKRFQDWADWLPRGSIISWREWYTMLQISLLEEIARRCSISTEFYFAWGPTSMWVHLRWTHKGSYLGQIISYDYYGKSERQYSRDDSESSLLSKIFIWIRTTKNRLATLSKI